MFIVPSLKGLVGGNFTGNTFNQAVIDLKFSTTKSLVDAVSNTELVTYTSSTSGTYVDNTGNVVKTITNFLIKSEKFDDAVWVPDGLQPFGSGSVVNAILSPTGTLTADKIVEDTSLPFIYHGLYQDAGIAFTTGTVLTVSVYAKAAERRAIALYPVSNIVRANFNLVAGTVQSVDAGVTASIENVGNGWYRCSASEAIPGTRPYPLIAILNNEFEVTYTGDGVSGVYIWGAQLENALSAGTYVPTENIYKSLPRFDHDPITGRSLGLLVEDPRSNLLVRSQELENASWTKASGNTVITPNQTISPDGTQNADLMTAGASTFSGAVRQAPTVTNGTVYTLSAFVKRNNWRYVGLRFNTGIFGAEERIPFYDFDTDTFSTGGVSATIDRTLFQNGWVRLSISYTATSTSGLSDVWLTTSAGGTAPAKTGTESVYVWGVQLEEGFGVSSYISTPSFTISRSADLVTIDGTNFSQRYNQSSGSVYWEGITSTTAGNTGIFSFYNSSSPTSNRQSIRQGSTIVTTGGTQVANFTNQTAPVNATAKIGYCYALDNYFQVLNSSTTASDTSGALPININSVDLGKVENVSDGLFLKGTISRFTYWNKRLPNSTLQLLTQ